MTDRFFTFVGGHEGPWRVRSQTAVAGAPLPAVDCLAVVAGSAVEPHAGWVLRGLTSNERYVEHTEKQQLVAKQQGLGRLDATCAALIPIRKTAAWWTLPQDQRRDIFEAQSRHIRIGMKYLPPIARRLHHCRDISGAEPFDFLTWFEYLPRDESAFEELLAELRASAEWLYVEREVDVRLVRSTAGD